MGYTAKTVTPQAQSGRDVSPILHGGHSLAGSGEGVLLLPLLKVLYSVDGWSLPGRRSGVVVDVINSSPGIDPTLPTGRKRLGALPRRRPSVVIDVVRTILMEEGGRRRGRRR